MVKGVHYVRSKRPDGTTVWYVYACRGGEQILRHVGSKKPKLTDEALRLLNEVRIAQRTHAQKTIGDLIMHFRKSPQWVDLSNGTRRTWGSALDAIERKWGGTPLTVWSDPRMKAKVVDWRDSRASTPRGADIGITVLSRLLEFGLLRNLVRYNAAAGIPNLYKGGGRSLIVWTEEDMTRFAKAAIDAQQPQMTDGMRLASLTGLRRQDLVVVTFDDIQDGTLSTLAQKQSRNRRFRATIPILPELSLLIEELRNRYRRPGVATLLVNSFGNPWSEAGFTGSFGRIRDKAEIVGIDEQGQTTPKHLHDLRGTFCTKLCMAGLSNEEVGMVMGWSPEQVAGIRRTYVDQNQVVKSIARRLGHAV